MAWTDERRGLLRVVWSTRIRGASKASPGERRPGRASWRFGTHLKLSQQIKPTLLSQ